MVAKAVRECSGAVPEGIGKEGHRGQGKEKLDRKKEVLYLTIRLNTMSDSLSSTLAALADPTRRAILARLSLGARSVTELAEPFEMSLPAVSKHLKVLEHAGLITRGREAQWRPCRLHAEPLKEVANWVEEYRRFWAESFDRLDDYLQELQAKEKKNGRKK
jgi:DNA-binding transcriptional ArsR family regulator